MIRLRLAMGVCTATCIAALCMAVPVGAQALRLAADAEVRSIDFRFHGKHELFPAELSSQIATTAPGTGHGIHSALSWIPFVPDPPHYPLNPVALQEDVVRLRNHYRRQGFLSPQIDYQAQADQDRRLVKVTFLIEEGPFLRLRSLRLIAPDGSENLPLPSEIRDQLRVAWEQVQKHNLGHRFREERVATLRAGLDGFLADQGYARAAIQPRAVIDSVGGWADLEWVLDPGTRSRFGPIAVEGVTKVPVHIASRQLGIQPGQWTSRTALERARANLLSMELFRSAEFHLAKGQPTDTTLPVRVAIREDRPRFTQIEGGYITDGAGISGQVRWTHPNFTGGARSLSAIGLFQTGWGATSEIKDQLARATLVLTQPYVGAPDLSLSVGPSYEFRDGHIDRSVAWSAQSTLVWRFNTLQSAALRYEYTYREVDETRSRQLTEDRGSPQTLAILGSEALLDSLTAPVRTSLFTLSTTLGGLDDIARPQRGAVIKPNVSITWPPALGNVEFARIDMQATVFTPIPGRSNSFMLRGNLGNIWPFGQSIPEPGENPVVELVRLRDYTLTAGGANDVRGYASRMLGPKLPQIEASTSGSDTIFTSDRYVEIGGLQRWTATAELRIGVPRISRDIFAHVFADAGRVWTSDPRFLLSQVPAEEQRVFYTTGGGIGYYTPVGAIRFDVGYKLNPSVFDLRDPQDVLDAVLAGLPASAAPINPWRRYGAHLALGLFF